MSDVTVDDITEFLAKISMFRGLKPAQLKKLAERARVRDYDKDQVIVAQNTAGLGLFIMARGEAEVRRLHADGNVTVVDTLSRFDFFGELSLLDDAPRSATVVAIEPVKAVVLTKFDFLDELEDDPKMAITLLKQLAHRFRRVVTNL
ncbi:MAG: cyclic nucleotide-binding domain-containing protein [Chloroflexota bacterium]